MQYTRCMLVMFITTSGQMLWFFANFSNKEFMIKYVWKILLTSVNVKCMGNHETIKDYLSSW